MGRDRRTTSKLTIDGHLAIGASSFRVPSGAVTAVIGPNGSGKSTLLNLSGGPPAADQGNAGGVREGCGPLEAGSVAYVLQATNVNETLPISVREVVTMGRYVSRGLTGRLGDDDRAAVAEGNGGSGHRRPGSPIVARAVGRAATARVRGPGAAQDHQAAASRRAPDGTRSRRRPRRSSGSSSTSETVGEPWS